MKKYILILGASVTLTFVSCGGESTTTETTDSTHVDSSAVQVGGSSVTGNDTTVSHILQDGEPK